MSFNKLDIPQSLIDTIKKLRTEAKASSNPMPKHPEDVKTPANTLEPEGTKKWLTTDEKKKKKVQEADICPVCKKEPCECEKGNHVDEASSPAQQAAIAIAMKKAGKKPKDMQEAEGSGTTIKDTKTQAAGQAERAKLTLQSALLKLKQAKEREALSKKKKAIKESFSQSQIDRMKDEYSKINTIDPSSDNYKKLTAMLDKMDKPTLEKLAGAQIKFVSGLARNRVNRMKLKEELTAKQKKIDKNKNGKIDGDDLSKLRSEEDYSEFKQGGPELAKKFNKAFKALGVDAKVKIKTVGNVSVNEEEVDEAVVKGKGYDNPENDRKAPSGKVPMTSLLPGHNDKAARLAAVQAKGRLVKGKAQSAPQKEEVELEEMDKSQPSSSRGAEGLPVGKKATPIKTDKVKQDALNVLQKSYKKEEVEVDEAKSDYEIYHKDFSTAVQHAMKTAEKRGYKVDMDSWHDKVSTGPRKPSEGKTNSYSITLMGKDGKPSKKALQMQVYNKGGQNPYELNMYIEDFDMNSIFAEAMKKNNKKEVTANDNNKTIKSGDKLTGKKEPITLEPELNNNK